MLTEIKTTREHCFVDEYDLIQGEYKDYYDNGQLWGHIFYQNGKRHGEYKEYYKNGQLWEHSFFQNDKQHGEYKVYHDNGQLWVHSSYTNGKLHGEYHQYDQNGNPIESTIYCHDTNLNVNPDSLTEKDKTYILLSGRLPPRD